ncbi:hypothetical protein TNCV_1822131 [Trichonephila clavipes]|nr:hypothetical protein TNCV_1822131 [Trichonephila clavipes]
MAANVTKIVPKLVAKLGRWHDANLVQSPDLTKFYSSLLPISVPFHEITSTNMQQREEGCCPHQKAIDLKQ